MTFGLLTISYRRPKILHLFLASVKRLRQETGIDFKCVCVGDEEHKDICGLYGVHHIGMKNHPATDKWNEGTKWLMEQEVDWVIVMGSDDIMSTSLLKKLITAMELGVDLVGIKDVYFYASDGKYKGSLRKLTTKDQVLGVCRCIPRKVIESVNNKVWNKESSWGMDGIALRNIRPYIKTWKIVDGVCVDVKSNEEKGVQLNKFTMWIQRIDIESDPEIFYQIMGEEEKLILSQI